MKRYYCNYSEGLGDRLEGIGIMLALKQLGFNIKIFWSHTSRCFPVLFEEIFHSHKEINLNKTLSYAKFFGKRLRSFKVFAAKNIKNSMMRNKCPEIIINSIREYGINNFQILCAQKIKKLEPLISINAEVERFRKKHFTGNMVGLHIRSTDKIDIYNSGKLGGPERYNIIINELHQEIEREIRKNKIFFCVRIMRIQ